MTDVGSGGVRRPARHSGIGRSGPRVGGRFASSLVAMLLAGSLLTGCDAEGRPPDLASWVYRHSNEVKAVAISPDGKLALTGGDDRMVHIWEIESGEERVAIEVEKAPRWAGFLDDKTVLLADGATVWRWHWTAGLGPFVVTEIEGSPRGSDRVVVLPDGLSMLATPNRLCRYTFPRGALIGCYGRYLRMDLQDYAASPDGRLAATCRWFDGRIRLWDLGSGEMLGEVGDHGAWVMSLAFTSDGRRLASAGDKVVKLWDVAERRQVGSLGEHPHDVWAIALTPDDSRLVAGAEDGTIHVWDLESGEELHRLTGHAHQLSYPFRLAVGPQGRLLLSGSRDWSARLWDLEAPAGPPRTVGWESPELARGRPGDLLHPWGFPHWTAMLLITVLVSWLGCRALASAIGRTVFVYLPLAALLPLLAWVVSGQEAGEHLAGNTVKIALLLSIVDAMLERHRPRRPSRVGLGYLFALPLISLFLYYVSVLFGVGILLKLLAGRFGYPPSGLQMQTAVFSPPTFFGSGSLNWPALFLLLLVIGVGANALQRKRMEKSFGDWL